MKSIIKSLNTNCCYDGSSLVRQKSEKELSYDLKAQSFTILDIKHIRKNYQQNKLLERSLNSMAVANGEQSEIKVQQKPTIKPLKSQKLQVSSQKRKSLISTYCQKVSKVSEGRISLVSKSRQKNANSMDRSQSQIKRQKLQITYGKSSNLNNFKEIRNKNTQGYLQIDRNRSSVKNTDVDREFKVERQRSEVQKIEPKLRNQISVPNYYIPKPIIIKQKQTSKISICTTSIDNSHNYSILNSSNPLESTIKTISKAQKAQERSQNQNSDLVDLRKIDTINLGENNDKENSMNAGNKMPSYKRILKGKAYNIHEARTNDREEKVTDSILFSQNPSPQRNPNLSLLEPSQTNLFALKQQISNLQQEYNQLKTEQLHLLNKLSQDQNDFESKYQVLLQKKSECQMQQKKRSQEIDQIKRLLHQRTRQIHQKQSTSF